jgi:hypothetical protein
MGYSVLDQIFALDYIQAVGNTTQVHAADVSAYFATNAAGT